MSTTNPMLWQPSQIEDSLIFQFQTQIEKKHKIKISNYGEFHQFSIQEQNLFWLEAVEFFNLKFKKIGSNQVFAPEKKMKDCKWFSDYELNYAEVLLSHESDDTALISVKENGTRKSYSYKELKKEVLEVAAGLKKIGVKKGDRVAGYLANDEYAVIAFLASNTIGAIWTCCAAEFGKTAVVERLRQTKPKVLFTTPTYHYANKTHQLVHPDEICNEIGSIEKVVMISEGLEKKQTQFIDYQDLKIANQIVAFESLDFNYPLYILYSSGTTGNPKCITHAVGRVLLNHLKEHQFHCNIKPQDVVFFYTTCGWMMWNWLVSALASKASIVLYDGSPFSSKAKIFDLIESEKINHAGVGAKIVDTFETFGLVPKDTHNLASLKSIWTTASPLLEHNFRYVYEKIKKEVILSSISGGSDIVGCFLMGNPTLPVYQSELQCFGLTMDIDVFNADGQSVQDQQGELVCKNPFINMPIGFWGDKGDELYHKAYFTRFENIWAHGDFAQIINHKGYQSLIISGRSDTTLNPGGVRIGTGEIYKVVEPIDWVIDCACVGQSYQGDERIVLFVVLRDNLKLNEDLIKEIKNTIRTKASPRHSPAIIIQANELPRTMSGKITELAIKQSIHKEEVKNTSAIMNPQSLDFFRKLQII